MVHKNEVLYCFIFIVIIEVNFIYSWRCFYYSLMFGYGMAVLWKKQWLWDIRYCWYHYPHHAVEGDVWWYYMIELTFYWSLTFSQFYDVKRKGNIKKLTFYAI